MDPATKVKIAGALWTVALPVGAAAATLALGRRARPGAGHRPALTSLAMLAGISTAWFGINGWPGLPPQDADGWAFWALLTVGLLGLGLRAVPAAVRPWATGGFAAAALVFFGWRLVAPLAIWSDGVVGPLGQSAWLADALGLAFVTWIALDRAAQEAPAPVVLGPLAVAMVGAAAAIALSGSARLGQTLGALGAVTGAVGLIGWRWPDLRPGAAGVGAAVIGFALLLIDAQAYVDVSRPALTLLLLAPLGAVAGARLPRTLPAVGVALALAAAPVGLGVYLAYASQDAPGAAPGDAAPADAEGSYYPY